MDDVQIALELEVVFFYPDQFAGILNDYIMIQLCYV